MCGRPQCKAALENTGLVDKFIIKPEELYDWTDDEKREWFAYQVKDLQFEHFCRCRPGRFMWHPTEDAFYWPSHYKVAYNKGISYFDALAESLKVVATRNIQWPRREGDTIQWFTKSESYCVRNGVPEAFGKRPVTRMTHKERSWLRDFRYIHNIPKDAFLLGWQFTGSSQVKWYPYFREVIQYAIMTQYPNVHVIGLGDMKELINWTEEHHGGRFINLRGSVSFRQAYLLTSILDLLVSPETGIYVFAQAYPQTPKILLATHTNGTHISLGSESVILAAQCDCAPCYNIFATCDTDPETGASKCMASIKPEVVIKAIEEVIHAST